MSDASAPRSKRLRFSDVMREAAVSKLVLDAHDEAPNKEDATGSRQLQVATGSRQLQDETNINSRDAPLLSRRSPGLASMLLSSASQLDVAPDWERALQTPSSRPANESAALLQRSPPPTDSRRNDRPAPAASRLVDTDPRLLAAQSLLSSLAHDAPEAERLHYGMLLDMLLARPESTSNTGADAPSAGVSPVTQLHLPTGINSASIAPAQAFAPSMKQEQSHATGVSPAAPLDPPTGINSAAIAQAQASAPSMKQEQTHATGLGTTLPSAFGRGIFDVSSSDDVLAPLEASRDNDGRPSGGTASTLVGMGFKNSDIAEACV